MIKKIINNVNQDDVRIEDSGQAKILDITELDADYENINYGIFIKLVSWDESKEHKEFNALIGKAVRVTIETIPTSKDELIENWEQKANNNILIKNGSLVSWKNWVDSELREPISPNLTKEVIYVLQAFQELINKTL